ncbi:proline-rich receptor-like protein kinase PERK9 [Calypte anna]|uniref:proline-rich receptor-like protein kinase PERK9 n=1 Tax=Calypte anna TaxID=9244 RepID=UPI0011C382E1|nr:proline-rich receptor-like protein kinase PERK9 [Calypte anna]
MGAVLTRGAACLGNSLDGPLSTSSFPSSSSSSTPHLPQGQTGWWGRPGRDLRAPRAETRFHSPPPSLFSPLLLPDSGAGTPLLLAVPPPPAFASRPAGCGSTDLTAFDIPKSSSASPPPAGSPSGPSRSVTGWQRTQGSSPLPSATSDELTHSVQPGTRPPPGRLHPSGSPPSFRPRFRGRADPAAESFSGRELPAADAASRPARPDESRPHALMPPRSPFARYGRPAAGRSRSLRRLVTGGGGGRCCGNARISPAAVARSAAWVSVTALAAPVPSR